MRNYKLIKESKLLKIKSKILSNLLDEKYGHMLGEFNNITGAERVNFVISHWLNSPCTPGSETLIFLLKNYAVVKFTLEYKYKFLNTKLYMF